MESWGCCGCQWNVYSPAHNCRLLPVPPPGWSAQSIAEAVKRWEVIVGATPADQQVTKDMHSPWAAVFYVNAAV